MSFHRIHSSLSLKAVRTIAVVAVTAAGVAIAGAQTDSTAVSQPAATHAASSLNTPALDSSSTQLFSSSSDDQPTNEASVTPPVNFANYMQYGGGQRRRYGRPTYRGSNTTADGTPKYTFEVGAGFTQPLGNTWHYFTPSYGFQFGGGRNFDRHLGVLLQFDYDHMGLTGRTLSNQSVLYFNDPVAGDNGLDGSNHIWSFTLNPVYTLFNGGNTGGFGAYLVGGVGFYHKVTNFTVPEEEDYCDYYGFCGEYEANAVIDHYTSNSVGVNGGFGITYKFSRFSNERFFGEVRYVFIPNSQRQGLTVANASTFGATYTGSNYFPANSNRTTYMPVKFGIRF